MASLGRPRVPPGGGSWAGARAPEHQIPSLSRHQPHVRSKSHSCPAPVRPEFSSRHTLPRLTSRARQRAGAARALTGAFPYLGTSRRPWQINAATGVPSDPSPEKPSNQEGGDPSASEPSSEGAGADSGYTPGLPPLAESLGELSDDVAGLRELPGSFLEGAAGGGARAAEWWAALARGVRSWAEGILKPGGQPLSPLWWCVALLVPAVAIAVGMRSAGLVGGNAGQSLSPVDRARAFRLKHQLGLKEEVEAKRVRALLESQGLWGSIPQASSRGAGAEGSDSAGGAASTSERGAEGGAEREGLGLGFGGGAQRQSPAETEGPPAEFWVERQGWKLRPRMPYAWLLDKVHDYEVKSAVYSHDMRRLYVSLRQGFPSDFTVDVPVDPFLAQDLVRHGVTLGMLSRSNWAFLRGVAAVAPSIAILCLIGGLQGRMQELMNERMYDLLHRDRFQLILPEEGRGAASHEGAASAGEGGGGGGAVVERSAYSDVVMGDEIWQTLEEIMTYMRDPMKYYDQGVVLPRGILLSGPPGTGKTLLARSMARQCGLPFVFASGAEFVDSSAESGLDKVFNIFFTARASAPCFLFVDEIDALAGKSVVRSGDREAVFQEFLNELDGSEEHTDVDRLSRRQAVVLIAATNRPQELHEELLAPGRIDREVHISLPTEEQRVQIFGVHSRTRTLAPSLDFSQLAFRTVGFSGADIRNLVNEASIIAVRRGHAAIEQEDLVAALDKQLFESLGVSMTDDEQKSLYQKGLGVSMTDEEQKSLYQKVPRSVCHRLAVHEAGHVLLAHLFPSFDWHAFTDILPAGQEKALSVFYPRQSMLQLGHATEGYVRMQMVVAHGGRCAERVVFGDQGVSDAGQDDLIKISRMARELACSASSPRLGILPLTMHPVMDPPPLPGEANLIPNSWSRPGTQLADMSIELSEMFTREVTKYVDEAQDMAMQALTENRHILDQLAEHLLENYRISGLDAAALIRLHQPCGLPDLLAELPDTVSGQGMSADALSAEQPGRYAHLDLYPADMHRC